MDGEWNAWTGWSACSVTCGSGRETRTRHCNNPAPEYGGKMCPGNTTESKSCYPAYCSGMGNFTFPHHSPRFFFIYVHTSTYLNIVLYTSSWKKELNLIDQLMVGGAYGRRGAVAVWLVGTEYEIEPALVITLYPNMEGTSVLGMPRRFIFAMKDLVPVCFTLTLQGLVSAMGHIC